jgi:hypothetical protein
MRNNIEFEVRLPKGVKITDISARTIALDENWITTVRENHRNIDELKLKDARRKYA